MGKRGLFITFEGADGSGKTTQLELLAKHLKEKNIDFIITREPGGNPLGNKLRDILLNYDGEVSDRCELFLYLADRAQHIDKTVLPALKEGKIVLCDRHTDSTLAYQGYARGLDIELLENLNDKATNSLKPDLTLVFDVETQVASQRVGDEKDRMEAQGKEFHKKVRYGYLDLAKKYPQRIKVINSNNSIQEVYLDMLKIINSLI